MTTDQNTGARDRRLFDLEEQTAFANCHTFGSGLIQVSLFFRNLREIVCLLLQVGYLPRSTGYRAYDPGYAPDIFQCHQL